MCFLKQGYSYIEIANAMNISIYTAKKYIRVTYSKLKINSKFELIDLMKNGSININPRGLKPLKSHIKSFNATEKEQMILSLLKKKKTVKEIASELFIAQISTKYYIRKFKQKRLVD